MNTWKGVSSTTRNWTSMDALPDYKENIAYDAMGNILSYLRNATTLGSNSLAMDDLNYLY
jgi:hypothetical protein